MTIMTALDEAGRAKALTARLSSQPREFAAVVSATAAPVLEEMTDRMRQIQPILARVPDLSTDTAILADPERRFEWPRARHHIREMAAAVAHDTAQLAVHRERLVELVERVQHGARICEAVAEVAGIPEVVRAARVRAMDLHTATEPALQTVAALDLVLAPLA